MNTPAFLLAGTHSGSGKSTLCAGLLRAYRNRGCHIAPFKAGPDYLDPKLHKAASNHESWNLDAFFQDEEGLLESFERNTRDADLALVEGVMGLFDGYDPVHFKGSAAHLAKLLDIPVVLVVDGAGVGASLAATVLGHKNLMPELHISGVILNRVSGAKHAELQQSAIVDHTGIPVIGYLPKQKNWSLPERHLGIHQPEEIQGLDQALDELAKVIEAHINLDALQTLARPVRSITDTHAPQPSKHLRVGLRVGLSLDEAFNFIYPDTLDCLERLGVEWVPFSPLRDSLPERLDGLYLCGGYPELHAEKLSQNQTILAQLRQAHQDDLPIFAECGGYMLLGECLTDITGQSFEMAGVIPGRFRMTERLRAFGYKHITAECDNLLAQKGEVGKAHEFHHSQLEALNPAPAWKAEGLSGKSHQEGYAKGNLLASYAHLHFGAQRHWAERWVKRMEAWKATKAK